MNYVDSFKIFGQEVTQIPCTILSSAPTEDTFGVVGMLAIDNSSEKKDLYKCIAVEDKTDGDGNIVYDGDNPVKVYTWNAVGSSATVIVDEVPDVADADPDVDYIVYKDGVCLYYKLVDDEMKLIAGSVAEVVDTIEGKTGNTYTDYYVPNKTETVEVDGVEITNVLSYFHYRWNGSDFVMIGADSYSMEETNKKIEDIQKDYTGKINSIKSDIGERTTDTTGSIFKRLEDVEDAIINNPGDNDKLKITYNKDISTLYLHYSDSDEEVDENKVLSITTIEGGGGGLTGSVNLSFNFEEDKSKTILKGDKAKIKYIAYIYTEEDEIKIPVAGQIKLSIYNDVNSNTPVEEKMVESTTKENELDLTPYLSSSSSKTSFKVIAKYAEVIEEEQLIHSKRKYCDFTQVELSLTPRDIDFDQTVKTSSPVTYWYNITGTNLNKTVHYKLDNNEIVHLKEEEGKITNGENFIDLPITTHGNHKFEIWCTADIDGKTIPTKHYHYDIMFAEQGNNEPIIRALLNKITEEDVVYEQYYTIPFFYSVYAPNPEEIEKVIVSKDGKDNIKEYVNSSEIEDSFTPETPGNKTIIITCKLKDGNDIKETLSLSVIPSQYKIPPAVSAGLAFDFIPDGRTNSDIDYNVLYDVDGVTPIENGWTFSDDFDWVNGGWQYSAEDGDSFCIKAGSWVEFDYKLFNDPNILIGENNTRGNGAEFKIKFKTTNVADVTTQWFDCVANDERDNPMGLKMNVHEAYFISNKNNLKIPYSEEDIIELDINITPITLKDKAIDFSIPEIPMIMTYEDGTPMRPSVIDSKDAIFKQETPAKIKIGGKDCKCDVYIYRMKAYSNFLTENQIIQNFIADAKGAEKNSRFTRNQVFDGTNLTPDSVAKACPHLRIIKISAPRFTIDKDDKVPETEIEMIYPKGNERQNWKATHCMHSGQGTSSNAYGYAGRNLDLIMDIKKIADELEVAVEEVTPPTVTFDDGTVLSGDKLFVQLHNDPSDQNKSIPTNYLNIKVNIASSEHTNNALLAKRYDRYLPYSSLAENRYIVNGEKIYDAKNTMEFYNCVVFIQETGEQSIHKEFADNKWHFYSLGNIGDSKKTDKTRVVDPTDENEFCNEILDWNLPLSNFPKDTNAYIRAVEIKEGDTTVYPFEEVAKSLIKEGKESEIFVLENGEYTPFTGDFDPDNVQYYIDALKYDDFGGDFTYDFRYSIKSARSKARNVWKNFYHFVTQDIWERDGNDNIVQIEDDNGLLVNKIDPIKQEQWKNGLKEWFIEKSAFYYYAFTLRYSMIDNRAKNSFWHYAKTGVMRKVSNPVDDMLHVYYEKASKETLGAEYFLALNEEDKGYYIKTTGDFSSEKEYYTQYAFEFWDYDNDTALGIDNTGEFRIDYGVEEIDGQQYFRAHDSTFFVNLSNCFASEITDLYNNTHSDCFNEKHLITEFDSWQSEFPEQLWRMDYETKYKRTYVAGHGEKWDNRIDPMSLPEKEKHGRQTDFLVNKMNGRKKYQRRQFERDQSRYMAGRFDSASNMGDLLDLRVSLSDSEIPDDAPQRKVDFYVTARAKSWINIYSRDGYRFSRHRYQPNETFHVTNYPRANPNVLPAMDFLYIHNASSISDIGDISQLYMKNIDLGSGQKMRKVHIGNADSKYNNTHFSNLTISRDHTLLEELNIQNIDNINDLPDLELLPNLKKLYAHGSGLTSATFSQNGLMEIAQLPTTIQVITAQNLYHLEELTCKDRNGTENYSGIYKLTIDNCPNLPQSHILDMVTEASEGKLNNLYLTGINWTDNNTLEDTNLLDKLASINSTLTGKIEIKGSISQSDLDTYQRVWSIGEEENQLNLIYDSSQIIPSFRVTYVNYNGTPLVNSAGEEIYAYVDSGATPPDPIEKGWITADQITKPMDDKYTYEFSNWDNMSQIYSDRVIKAEYTPIFRTFTVKWYPYEGGKVLDTKTVSYGTEAVYGQEEIDGKKVITKDNPTDSRYENQGIFKVFTGWNLSTGYVTNDMNVYATWDEANIKDFLDENDKPIPQDLSTLNVAGIKAIAEKDYFFDCFEIKDHVDITLGHDVDFNGVVSKTLINESTYFNGSDSAFPADLPDDIRLFGEDAPSFTLAIDYEFVNSDVNGTLVSCYEPDGQKGFALCYSSYPRIIWGDQYQSFGSNKKRDIVVIRHIKGENTLYIYASQPPTSTNSDTFSQDMVRVSKVRLSSPFTLNKLHFGALTSNLDENGEYSYTNYGKGFIHWCKIWYEDLGDHMAQQLAQWPHEVLRMECYQPELYYLAGSTTQKPKASFICNQVLNRRYHMYIDPVSGGEGRVGWEDTGLKTFLNDRFLYALPIKWQSILKEIDIPALKGNGSKETEKSTNIIYVPCVAEIYEAPTTNSDNNAVYKTEGSLCWGLTSFAQRVRFRRYFNEINEINGLLNVYTDLNDPRENGKTPRVGDIWRASETSTCKIFVSPQDIERYDLTTINPQTNSGGWFAADTHTWSRSPSLSTSHTFLTLYGPSNQRSSFQSSNLNSAICPCFSI